MKKNFRMWSAVLVGLATATAGAHPGHAPSDLVAEVASPLSGWDHALVCGTVVTLAILLARRIVQCAKTPRRPARNS